MGPNFEKAVIEATNEVFKKFQFLALKIILICGALILTSTLISTYGHGAELDGKAIYNQYCVFCHKADGKGGGPMNAADLTKTKLTEKELSEVIKNGKVNKMMPSFKSSLNEPQIEKIVEYIKGLKK